MYGGGLDFLNIIVCRIVVEARAYVRTAVYAPGWEDLESTWPSKTNLDKCSVKLSTRRATCDMAESAITATVGFKAIFYFQT